MKQTPRRSFPMSDEERRRQRELERYQAELGREPSRLPDDHPEAWQWNYTGTRAELAALEERLGLGNEPAVIDGQEELFG